MSNFEYIKPEDLYKTYSDAKTFSIPLHEPFDEFERIARNKPHPGIAKNLPKVTDGTLAALIQEQPKRIIQQIPTAKVVSQTNDWLSIVADFILEKEIIPNANQVSDLIQKGWAMSSKALTYGSQPAFVQFINRGDYFGTDFTLPYAKDVLLEPGKLSDRDSNVIFLRSWWTKSQIESIIYKEQMLSKSAKKRGDDYETGWDIDKLNSLKDKTGQKDQNAMSPNEKNKQLNAGFIEIVHCFQRGVGANFYSFSPLLGEKDNIIRTRKNKDPRGQIPIHYMYANIDMSNPLGRGSVELSGGMQNLLDSQVQSFQYMQALLMNPPIEKRGNFSKSTIKYAPAEVWDLGTDPNASVKPVQLVTEAVTSFPNNYGLIKSQILNLNSSTDTSVSSTSGNPGFSRTPAGVDMTQQRLGVSDNYLRKQFEAAMQDIFETMLNLYFAERSGTQDLQLDKITADKVREVAPDMVNDKNVIRINYDTETEKLQLKIDASSSSVKDNADQVTDLTQLLQQAQQDPYLLYQLRADGYNLKVGEAYRQMFELMGVTNIDKIISKMSEQEMQQGGDAGGMNPMYDKPRVSVAYDDLPPAAQIQVLANAGVNIQPQDVMQPNATQQLKTPAPAPDTSQDPSNHPIIKLMESLQIKFTDLPEDSKQELLQQIGMPSQMQSPTAQNIAIQATTAAAKVGQMHHQANQADIQNQQQQQQQVQDQQTQQQDQMLIGELTKRGYSPEQAQQAVDYMKQGVPSDQIINALKSQEQTQANTGAKA